MARRYSDHNPGVKDPASTDQVAAAAMPDPSPHNCVPSAAPGGESPRGGSPALPGSAASPVFMWAACVMVGLALSLMGICGCALRGQGDVFPEAASKPAESEKKSTETASKKGEKTEKGEKAEEPKEAAPAPKAKNRDKSTRRFLKEGVSEAQAVKEIALDLAKDFPKVETIKICQAPTREEWWIVLYDDVGHSYELRQYVWSRRHDKPEEFLVLDSVSKSGLKENLSRNSPDRKCKAFEKGDGAWAEMKGLAGDGEGKPKPGTRPKSVESQKGASAKAGSRSAEIRLVSDRTQNQGRVRRGVAASASGPEFVFLYGSEIKHPELLAWLESHGYDASLVLDATPAKLKDFGVVWNHYSASRKGGTANLERMPGAETVGLLIKVDKRLMEALDRRQGAPGSYDRGDEKAVVTRLNDGTKVHAWLYTARAKSDDPKDVWPTGAYKKKMLEAALFWGFPEGYVDRIRTWQTR